MDCSSSIGTAKTDHLAVDLAPTALSAWRSFRCPVGSGIGVRFSAVNIRKNRKLCTHAGETNGCLNRAGTLRRSGESPKVAHGHHRALMENLRGGCREAHSPQPMLVLRKTQRPRGHTNPDALTTGLGFVVGSLAPREDPFRKKEKSSKNA